MDGGMKERGFWCLRRFSRYPLERCFGLALALAYEVCMLIRCCLLTIEYFTKPQYTAYIQAFATDCVWISVR
jgi:hypothetical protein